MSDYLTPTRAAQRIRSAVGHLNKALNEFYSVTKDCNFPTGVFLAPQYHRKGILGPSKVDVLVMLEEGEKDEKDS